MEETVKENEQKEIKTNKSKLNLFFKVSIFVWIIVILICGTYLFNSFSMVNKYDVDKFKLGKFEITTLNGVLKKNRKLVYASDKNDVVTLKYDINDLTLNNVYEYLQELSSEGYTIVNLEDLYMRENINFYPALLELVFGTLMPKVQVLLFLHKKCHFALRSCCVFQGVPKFLQAVYNVVFINPQLA